MASHSLGGSHGDSLDEIPEKIQEEEKEDFKQRQRRRSSVPKLPLNVPRRSSIGSAEESYCKLETTTIKKGKQIHMQT